MIAKSTLRLVRAYGAVGGLAVGALCLVVGGVVWNADLDGGDSVGGRQGGGSVVGVPGADMRLFTVPQSVTPVGPPARLDAAPPRAVEQPISPVLVARSPGGASGSVSRTSVQPVVQPCTTGLLGGVLSLLGSLLGGGGQQC